MRQIVGWFCINYGKLKWTADEQQQWLSVSHCVQTFCLSGVQAFQRPSSKTNSDKKKNLQTKSKLLHKTVVFSPQFQIRSTPTCYSQPRALLPGCEVTAAERIGTAPRTRLPLPHRAA